MSVSVIIPCFNESQTIRDLLQRVVSNLTKDDEIIVVDDASTDDSLSLVLDFQGDNAQLKVIKNEINSGKGFCLREGIKLASKELILIQDADLEYDPSEYAKLLTPLRNNVADVVYGSRFLGGGPHRVVYFWHRVANYWLTLLSNMSTNLNLSDMETCFKAFRATIIKKIDLKENRFGFEPEVTSKIARLNVRFFEVGISYYGRTYEEGKKIGFKDGVRAVYCIFKYGFLKID